MACKECAERREKLIDAVIEGRIAAATGHALKGAVEFAGLKAKTATSEPPATPKPKRGKRS